MNLSRLLFFSHQPRRLKMMRTKLIRAAETSRGVTPFYAFPGAPCSRRLSQQP